MALDWLAQQLRLSFFSSESIPVSEAGWTTITGQAEAETRISIPTGGKQYSGKFSGGVLALAYSSTRGDVILAVDQSSVEPDNQLPAIGRWDEISQSFASSVEPFLEAIEPPIVRIAFGAVLLSRAESREDAYQKLGHLLDSVTIDPQRMRDLTYRINWPLMSKVIPDLELNRITSWGAIAIFQSILQIAGSQASLAPASSTLNAVQLEIDHNTAAGRNVPFERTQRIPIFRELVSLAHENGEAGECP